MHCELIALLRFRSFMVGTWLCLALFTLCSTSSVEAQVQKKVHRIALSIGNQAYSEVTWGKLQAPAKDSQDVGSLFREAGFLVTQLENLRGKALRDAIDDFIYEIETVKRDIRRRNAEQTEAVVALFFYSGHGFSLSDSAWLPGIDADGSHLEDVLPNSYRLAQLVNALTPKDGDVDFLSVLMIDACRKVIALPSRTNSAQKGSSFQRGVFADIGGFGRIAIFASTNGKASYDARPGVSENSVFTEAIRRAALDRAGSRSFSKFVENVETLTPVVSAQRFAIKQFTEVSKVGVVNDFPVRSGDEPVLASVVAATNAKGSTTPEIGFISLGKVSDDPKATFYARPPDAGAMGMGDLQRVVAGARLELLTNPVVRESIPESRIVCKDTWINLGPLRTKGPPSCSQITTPTPVKATIPKGLEVVAVGEPQIKNGEAWVRVAYEREAKF